MKKKIIIISSLIVVLVFGILYTQSSNLIADDKDGKKKCSSTCTDKTSSAQNKSQCGDKSMSGANVTDDKGVAVYEFVTDKIHCDACKTEVSGALLKIAGVKEINYGMTCNVSKMTNVQVSYSSTETTPEIIAASIKDNGLQGNCKDGSKCTDKSKVEKKL